jgi:predicted nucleic acid-binding protein
VQIVSNSSPLIYLANLGDFDLLKALFGSITIPPAVYREVVLEGSGQPGEAETRKAHGQWLTIAPEPDRKLVGRIMREQGLAMGEIEVIVLAQTMRAEAIVMDDQGAVTYARTCGLDVVRTGAIYVSAKRAGLIESVLPKLDQLRDVGFRLKQQDYEAVLRLAGEL